MPDAMDSLTDDQAIRSIRLLYDVLPPDAWEGGHKPSPERVRTLAAGLKEGAAGELKPVVEGLLEGGDAHARAEVCRLLLRQFQQSASLKPYAERAVALACEPHMAIDPVTGAFILALLAMACEVEKKPDGSWHFAGWLTVLLKNPPLTKLIENLPAILGAVPKSLVDAVARKLGL